MTSGATTGGAAGPGAAAASGQTAEAADVPPASDAAPDVDVTETEQYRTELATIRPQQQDGELRPLDAQHPFPPTRNDEQQPETD